MQVPDSFYFGKPVGPEPIKRKEGERVQPADESFRKLMARDGRKAKSQGDVSSKKQGKSFEEIEESSTVSSHEEIDKEEGEFSLFEPKKPVKAQTRAPYFTETQESVQDEPQTPHVAKQLVKETERKAQAPDSAEQQQHLDEVRIQGLSAGVKKNQGKASVFDFASQSASETRETEKSMAEGEEIADAALQEQGKILKQNEPVSVFEESHTEASEQQEKLDTIRQEYGVIATPKKDKKDILILNPSASASDEIVQAEDPAKKAIHEGKEQPKTQNIIVQKQQSADHIDQQSQLDDVRQGMGILFADKKKSPEEGKAIFDYGSPYKPASKGETIRTIPESRGGEEAQIVEKPLPKDSTAAMNSVIEKEKPEIKQIFGNPEEKAENVPVKEKTSGPAERGTHTIKDNTPLDPRSIAFVNPDALNQDIANAGVGEDKKIEKPPLAHKLQELVDQIIKEIYTLRDEGKSETTLVLQHPPLFVGVKVTIETFKHAPNELNITFANLTGPGKRLLDENMASLRTALQQNERGYIVHQLHTTTLNEVPPYVAAAEQFQRNQDEKGGGSGQQHQEPEQQDQRKKRRKA